MDFELSKSQKQIQKAVKDFVKGEFKKELIQDLVEQEEFPRELWGKAADLGFIGIQFPQDYSGQELGFFEDILIAEELCHGDSSVGSCIVKASQGAGMIMHHGTEKQKQKWLPQIAEGEILCSEAYTEPGIGNDFLHSTTTAVRDSDHWVIDGGKNYVVNAGPLTGCYVVLCRTDSSSDKPGKGLSTIIVEADRDGVEIKQIGKRLGNRLMRIGNLQFNQVRVPIDNLVGKENRGAEQVINCLAETELLASACAVGIAQGAFNRAFSHVKTRKQFGQKLIDFQATQQKIADMTTRIAMARLMTWQAACSLKKRRVDIKSCAMAKLTSTKVALQVCDESIQLFGGYGYIEEFEVERFFRDAKMADIFDGNQVFLREVISSSMMKRKIY